MLADPTLTAIGSWLATYWVHAAVAVLTTWVLVHTLLRGGSSELRAAAWRAALVAPLVTATLRHFVFEHSAAIEVAWLDAGRHSTGVDALTQRALETHEFEMAADNRALSRDSGHDAALDSRERATGAARTDASDTSVERSRDLDDPADLESGALRRAGRREVAPVPRATTADTALDVPAVPQVELASGSTSSTPASLANLAASIEPQRLALLAAACAALLALARWFDGWWRLSHRLARRSPLPLPQAERAAHLAGKMGVPSVRITQSPRICVPMAFGFVQREVCLPLDFHEGLSSEEWSAAVAHELAHHVRGDGRWLPVLRLLSRLLAFQPLNLLAWREVQRESEHAADEEAVRYTGAAEALALCLAKVAARINTRHAQLPAAAMTGAPTMAARPALVVERAERLVASLDDNTHRPRRGARFAALLPTALIAAFGPHLAPLLAADSVGRMHEPIDAPHEGTPHLAAVLHTDASAGGGDEAADELLDAASELEEELLLARNEFEFALTNASDDERASLASMLERLTTLEVRTALLERLIHGRGADAKATPFTTSPDRNTTPVTTR